MPDLTEFNNLVNPYSAHNLKGEEAFLEQLAQCISVLSIELQLDEKKKKKILTLKIFCQFNQTKLFNL